MGQRMMLERGTDGQRMMLERGTDGSENDAGERDRWVRE